MAITRYARGTAGGKGVSSLTVTLNQAITAGNSVLVCISSDSTVAIPGVILKTSADVEVATLTQDAALADGVANQVAIYSAHNVSANGAKVVITFAMAITAGAATVSEVGGLGSSSPLDQTHTGSGNSATPDSGSTATTTQASELLIGAVAQRGPVTDSAGTWSNSFSDGQRDGTSGGLAASNATISEGYRIVEATGAYNAAKTGCTPRRWAAAIATYKAAVGGGQQFASTLTGELAAPAVANTRQTLRGAAVALAAFTGLLGRAAALRTALGASLPSWKALLNASRQRLATLAAALGTFSVSIPCQARAGIAAGLQAFSGALSSLRAVLRTITATLSPFTASVLRRCGPALAAVASFAARLASDARHCLGAALPAFVSGVARGVQGGVAGSLAAFTGALAGIRACTCQIAASLAACAGGVAEQTRRSLGGAVPAFTVSLRGAATWLHAIPAALAVFSGELLRAVDRKLGASLQAFTGVMGRAISASSIGGSVSFTAVLSRAAARLLALSGSLAEFGGDVARQTARRMAASLAGLTALTSRTVAVSVWFVAALPLFLAGLRHHAAAAFRVPMVAFSTGVSRFIRASLSRSLGSFVAALAQWFQRISRSNARTSPGQKRVHGVDKMTPLVTCRLPRTRSELDAAFADFLRVDVANGDASPDTLRNYRNEVALWTAWCLQQGLDPAAATATHIKQYRAALLENHYNPITIRWKLSIVRRFYEAARNAGLRADNPAAGVRSPRVRQAAEDFKYLCDEELARFFSVIPDPDQATGKDQIRRLRSLLIVSLLALHGLRTIEVHRANLEDLTEKGENLVLLVRGKTRDRIVYLRPDTARRLQQYLALRGKVEPDAAGTPLFCAVDHRDGLRLSRRHIRMQTDKYLRLAGLKRPGISDHALRHTAATLGYLHTGDLRAVQEFLGHADPRMTSRYAHVVDMAKRNPTLFIPVKVG